MFRCNESVARPVRYLSWIDVDRLPAVGVVPGLVVRGALVLRALGTGIVQRIEAAFRPRSGASCALQGLGKGGVMGPRPGLRAAGGLAWVVLLALGLAAIGHSGGAVASDGDARSLRSGDYSVHYNAIPSMALGADIARTYGLTRSATRGLVNIAVLRHVDGGDETVAVPATVEVSARSLLGQVQHIELRELRDQDAIYYIGQFRIRGEERLRFDIEARPEGGNRPIQIRFEHSFDGR